MTDPKTTKNQNRTNQIIDANLDRAREGLRVLEDWARFGLARGDLVKRLKDFRQILGNNHLMEYKESRNYVPDKCMGLTHPAQDIRIKTEDLISSNASRIQEALRVIEEYTRNKNDKLSQIASKIRYEVYSLEIQLLECKYGSNLRNILLNNNLYLITKKDPELLPKIEYLLKCGVKIVQHRFKLGNDSDFLREATEIKKLCTKYNALFIINDRLDIALACEADGVHLGQGDLDIESARKILGYSKIIGISASTPLEIDIAVDKGCDYLGIGPVFKTTTKENKVPLGFDKIKSLTQQLTIPWFAIGGINVNNISLLKEKGICKVAMISGLIDCENHKDQAKIIIKKLSNED